MMGIVRCAAAFLRAVVLFPLYFFGLTVFAAWPWRLGSPFFLPRLLGLLRRAPQTSMLRLLLLRLELRTDWPPRAPGPLRLRAMGQWLIRPFRETLPGCRRLAGRERKWSRITRLERLTLILNALPDSLRYANGMVTRFWFDPERRVDAANHIPNLPYHKWISCYLLNHALNPSLPHDQRHFDKVEFFATCRRHGLPTASVHASFRDGQVTKHDGVGDGPLLSKPAELAEGRGAFARWWPEDETPGGDRRYRAEGGGVSSYTEILERLAELSLETPYMLQALLKNHPDIQALSGVETLCTLRVPTCRFVDGRVEVLPISLFRIPIDVNAVRDNMAQGAIAYRVDVQSGRLCGGVTYDSRDIRTVHPTTERPVVGFTLPHFQEAVDLAVTAHASTFPTWPTVGWDLALTPEGPVLLEMNIQWCAEHDIPEERFLGQTPYTDCILGHIERLWPESMGQRPWLTRTRLP